MRGASRWLSFVLGLAGCSGSHSGDGPVPPLATADGGGQRGPVQLPGTGRDSGPRAAMGMMAGTNGDIPVPGASLDASTSAPRMDAAATTPIPDASVDPDVLDLCGTAVKLSDFTQPGHELIVDVVTVAMSPSNGPLTQPVLLHYLESITTERFPWLERAADCASLACFDRTSYRQLFFEQSDTSMMLLTGLPYQVGAGGAGTAGGVGIPNEDVQDIQLWLNAGAGSMRVLRTASIMPMDRIDEQLAVMERNASTVDAWHLVTAWAPGFFLDDAAGKRVIERGLALNRPIFLVHKGMPEAGYSEVHTSPRDMGPVAAAYPAARLIVQHAAFEHGLPAVQSSDPDLAQPEVDFGWGVGVGRWPEGPYDEADAAVQDRYPLTRGVNSLIKSLRDQGIGPGSNVYVSLDAVWAHLITRPTEAAHVLGKLLRYVGEDNILWATDGVIYGGPRPQIAAFRDFQIPADLRARYGYPELTPERKAKIFGLNAARLFCLTQARDFGPLP